MTSLSKFVVLNVKILSCAAGSASSSHSTLELVIGRKASGKSSTVKVMSLSSKHASVVLFVTTAFIVLEVVEKVVGNGLLIGLPFESVNGKPVALSKYVTVTGKD